MNEFTGIEKRILNRIQRDFKITADPLRDLALEMGIDHEKFLNTVSDLKKKGIIRDISAIFNAERLGYSSSLIAFQVKDKDVEHAASVINSLAGVSHNYLRDHKYNLWFTLAVDSSSSLEEKIEELAKKCRAKDYLILKKERLLKIGLMLNIGDRENTANPGTGNGDLRPAKSTILSGEEKQAVTILQMDLPIDKNPFKILLMRNNIDLPEKRLVEIGESLKSDGVMRRYSAVLRHHNAGYRSNAMTAWKIDEDKLEQGTIKKFSEIPGISHLYIRTVYPGKWEYPLFAMIHAKSDDELKKIIKTLERDTGISDNLVLKSVKEFKKKRVQYFPELINKRT